MRLEIFMLFAATVFTVIAVFELASWVQAALTSGSWFGSQEKADDFELYSGSWQLPSRPIPPRQDRTVELYRLTCFGGQSRDSTMAPDSRTGYILGKSKRRRRL